MLNRLVNPGLCSGLSLVFTPDSYLGFGRQDLDSAFHGAAAFL